MDKCKLTVENSGELKIAKFIYFSSLEKTELDTLYSKIEKAKNLTLSDKYDKKYLVFCA